MAGFQRARSEEQRAERREVILTTAAKMLTEMPVAEMSLNELSRRVGLAKSNVLRYFDSREAVLLDLLHQSSAEFLADVTRTLPPLVDGTASLSVRARATAGALAASFADRPMLCELISARAAVLERNVSAETALRFKQGSQENLGGFARLLRQVIPELDQQAGAQASGLVISLVGALWTRGNPAPALVAAYELQPDLSVMSPPFQKSLDTAAAAVLVGLAALAAEV